MIDPDLLKLLANTARGNDPRDAPPEPDLLDHLAPAWTRWAPWAAAWAAFLALVLL